MSVFCALANLSAFRGTASGLDLWPLGLMAARSRHRSLAGSALSGEARPGFVAAGPLQARRGDVHVVAAARLDEAEELRSALVPWIQEDREPPSAADLILASYLRWGERCPEHLLGDFAFVIWDGEFRRLLAARDPLGVKPFHLARIGSLLVMASEVLCLLGHPFVEPELDLVTVGDFLAGGEPALERTFFRTIRRLPPGHLFLATAAGERMERYWAPASGPRSEEREEDTAERFLALLQKSVGERLPGAGPVAVALSGGLDSSSVAALAHRERLRTGSPARILAGSLLFERLAECDERPYLQPLLAGLGIEPVPVEAERFWFLGDTEAYTPGLDTPVLSFEGGFRELLRRLVERGARVLLTGHGADNLLRGSGRIYADGLRRGDLRAAANVLGYARAHARDWHFLYRYLVEPLLPQRVERTLRRIAGRPLPAPEIPDWIAPGLAREADLPGRLGSSQEKRRALRTAREEIQAGLEQASYLRSVEWYDRVAAPYGIEVLHPFLDRRLFDLVLAAPPQHLFQLGCYKPLLRQAMTGILPESIRLRQDKARLGRFIDFSLREKASAKVEALISAPLAEELGLLSGARLRAAYATYGKGRSGKQGRTLWYALALELWIRQHAKAFGWKGRSAA